MKAGDKVMVLANGETGTVQATEGDRVQVAIDPDEAFTHDVSRILYEHELKQI